MYRVGNKNVRTQPGDDCRHKFIFFILYVAVPITIFIAIVMRVS